MQNSFRPPRCHLRLRTPATCPRRLHNFQLQMSPVTRKQSQGPVEKVYFPSSVPLSHNNDKRDLQKECYTHQFCGQDCHSSYKNVGWVQPNAPLQPLKKNVMILFAQLVEAEALNVMEASQYQLHSVHELVPTFQKCCTHLTMCTNFQILQKFVTKPTHGVSEYLPMNEDTDGQLLGL